MKTKTDYLGVIPARGGSKGVERKNIRPLADRPLIAHTIDAALNAENLARTVVSTDDSEIRSIAQTHGADVPFIRPKNLATDDAPTAPVLEHALDYLEENEDFTCSGVVLLQPTSPLRTAAHVDRAIELHQESAYTTVISVSEDHSYRWRSKGDRAEQLNYTGDTHRRQEKPPEYVENGAIYIVDTKHFHKHIDLRGGSVGLFEMDERYSVDIDTEFDFWLAEQIKNYLD